MKKTKLALGVTTALVAFAAATIAPEAAAHTAKKAHKHAKKAAVETIEHHTSSFTHTSNSNAKVDALESQLQSMQSEIRSLRAAANRPQIDPDTAKVQELDQWMQTSKTHKEHHKGDKDNMAFFRGGFGYNVDKRGGTLDPTAAPISGHGAWYFGAGLDFSNSDNLFGLMQGTEVLTELLVDYKQLGQRKNNGLFNAGALNTQTATVNSLSVAVSPKIKFLKGSNFRPWLIPAGFEISIISPPSDAITVLNPGMMFGAGADYKIWKDVYAGADVRWHQSFDNVDGVNTNGLTTGGYLGLGF